MSKLKYLVLALTLITGASLGWLDTFRFAWKAEASAGVEEIPVLSQRAPFFGQVQAKKDITQISPTIANWGVLISLYAEMSREELIAEFKRLSELSKKKRSDDEDRISFLLRYLARKVGRDFPGEVRSFLDSGLIDSSSDYAVPLLEGWGSKDFDGAMECLLENRNKWSFSSYVFPEMVRGLTEEQPDKAMEWMLSQTGKVRQNALSEMIAVLTEKHPAKIVDFVGKLLPEDLKKDNLFDTVAKSWGSCDWEAALLWADKLSDKQKNKAIAGILGELGTSNLEKATEEYKKYPKEDQGGIAIAIVESLSGKDDLNSFAETNDFSGRKQAFEWLMANRSEAVDAGVLARSIVDSSDLWTSDFADYVQKMPEGYIKDNALRDMSDIAILNAKYENGAYEEALALTDQIKDPAIRLESKLSNVRSWVNDDPEAARDWIQVKSGFSDEEKQKQFKACEEALKRLGANLIDNSNYTGEIYHNHQ